MKVNSFQNIPAILQSYGGSGSGKTKQTDPNNDPISSVSLSSFGEVFQSIQRESLQASQANLARVQQLSQQEEAGKLNVNIHQLASNLVHSNVIDTKG